MGNVRDVQQQDSVLTDQHHAFTDSLGGAEAEALQSEQHQIVSAALQQALLFPAEGFFVLMHGVELMIRERFDREQIGHGQPLIRPRSGPKTP